MKRTLVAGIVLGAFAVAFVGSLAQRPSAQSSKPTFEVASVKVQKTPGPSFDPDGSPRVRPGGRFTAAHATISHLIFFAYNLRSYQRIEGPDWILRDRFEIDAKAAGDAPTEQIRLMVRSLLEDRFRLVLRIEKREMRVLKLLLARGDGRLGPNIQRVEGDCTPENAAKARALLPRMPPTERGDAMMTGGCVPLSGFTDMLSIDTINNFGLPVLDETGLTGRFIYSMRFASPKPDPGVAPSRWPSFATALQEQLGFRLEEGRSLIEMLVIDSIQQPTAN